MATYNISGLSAFPVLETPAQLERSLNTIISSSRGAQQHCTNVPQYVRNFLGVWWSMTHHVNVAAVTQVDYVNGLLRERKL